MLAWIKKLFQNHEESENEFGNLDAKILDIRRRIDEQRASLNHKTSTIEKNTKDELQPSGGVHTRSEEPKLSTPSDQAAIKKQQELAAMKAKLLRKKSSPTK
jgi:hypothetical protein